MAAPSAEIQFAQKLAANEKKIRTKALKKLRKYIRSKSAAKPGLTEEDVIKLWKGLHYCMWMQDKPLLQEELAVHITGLVFSFSNTAAAMKFFKVFLVTEAREWNGIDRQRLDKFMMMTRQMLHEMFVLLRQGQWAEEMIAELATVLRGTTLNTTSDNVPDSFAMHFADIYLLELAKVGAQQLDGHQILSLLTVFDDYLQTGTRPLVLKRIIGSVYNCVAEQTLERLRREGEKEPQDDGVDVAKDDSDSGYDEDSEPKLKFDCLLLADHLFQMGSQEQCRGTNRQMLYSTVKRLQDAAAGAVAAADETEVYDPDADLEDAVMRLMNLNTKKKKKKKRQKDAVDEEEEQDEMDTHDAVAEETEEIKKGKKKQKRKLQETDSGNTAAKKVKLTPSSEADTKINTETSSTLSKTDSPKKKKRKKKKKKKGSTEVTEQGENMSMSKEGNPQKGASGDKVQDAKCISSSPPNKLTSETVSTKETSSSKKSKKKKRLKSTEEKTEVSPPKKTKTESEADEVSVKVKAEGQGENNIKGKKKKSSKSSLKGDEVSVSKETTDGNVSVSQETKDENDTLTRDMKDEPFEEGETEIWVPSKKYQAKIKAEEKRVKDKKIKTPKGSTFAKFEKLSTPPAAFVKKAIAKVMKTPLKKTNDAPKATPEMTASEKKVKFNMKKNTAQKFEDSMTVSPVPAFNPQMTPTQGILKSPASLTSAQMSGKKKKKKSVGINADQNTPVTRRAKPTPASDKKHLTRSRAADFF
ncbi:ribosomal RNA processing protein 1 homolog A-like [Haliotis asinina]|uniref:ribosomal RNA processing protein 1 homolog A-like n=1 Tax=Haliotis asinina TaxID=109174 RepID=UPI0035324A70